MTCLPDSLSFIVGMSKQRSLLGRRVLNPSDMSTIHVKSGWLEGITYYTGPKDWNYHTTTVDVYICEFSLNQNGLIWVFTHSKDWEIATLTWHSSKTLIWLTRQCMYCARDNYKQVAKGNKSSTNLQWQFSCSHSAKTISVLHLRQYSVI